MQKAVWGLVGVAILLAPLPMRAQEYELTANAGWLNQYYYRGIMQKNSSANAGLDIVSGVFSAGAWAADVGDGSEGDLYTSLAFDVSENLWISVGGTGYFYTGEFDDTYLEGNLGIGLGPLSLEYSLGSYRTSPEAIDYSFIALTLEQQGFFVTGGAFGSNLWLDQLLDGPGQYLEGGYGFSAAELDFTISGLLSNADLSGAVDDAGEPADELTLIFGVSKAFNIR